MWLTAGIFLLLIESFSPFGTVLTGLMGQAICVGKERKKPIELCIFHLTVVVV
jgi:hypothetical protein